MRISIDNLALCKESVCTIPVHFFFVLFIAFCLNIYFYLYRCFSWMFVCTLRSGYWIWISSYRCLWAAMWVLENKLEFSIRTASDLNNLVIQNNLSGLLQCLISLFSSRKFKWIFVIALFWSTDLVSRYSHKRNRF